MAEEHKVKITTSGEAEAYKAALASCTGVVEDFVAKGGAATDPSRKLIDVFGPETGDVEKTIRQRIQKDLGLPDGDNIRAGDIAKTVLDDCMDAKLSHGLPTAKPVTADRKR